MKSMMMMPAEVPQADLAHDLADRLEIDLEHGLLEVPLADVLARIDVDGDERLGMVDDDVAAGLEPHAPTQRLLDVLLDAERLEDRASAPPTGAPARASAGTSAAHVPSALVVDLAGVDDELVDLGREQIAHDAEGEVALLVEDRGRGRLLVARLDLGPQARQELDVGGELALALALGVRAAR